ncbi:hypothetical protein NA57DRAFT_55232 [Rhizodiscina lignyota]|uniref:Xylanolytic transcriptional activator regulatory domain-containing protein n=1 Tax=Rhizodiscina lignyota TaxID=1504668 RepID=A0A9P4IJF3_9PEZI|nr:hypothetical protein NA57DRAFT_55232 [Rhizodiscina lignyota]
MSRLEAERDHAFLVRDNFRAKIKCSGEPDQCAACKRRGVACSYPAPPSFGSASAGASAGTPAGTESISPVSVPLSEQSHLPVNSTAEAHEFPNGLQESTPSTLNPVFGVETAFPTDMYTQNPLPIDDFAFFDFSNDLDLNWLFNNSPSDDLFGSSPEFLANFQSLPDLQDNPTATHFSSLDFKVERGPQNDEPKEKLKAFTSNIPAEDPWPMAWNAEPLPEGKPLPPLARPDEVPPRVTGSFQKRPILPQARDDIQRVLGSSLGRPPWGTVSLANFPTTEMLNYCIDLFFARFHLGIAFVHRPTFDASSQDCVPLVLAMASIGACFTNFEGAKPFAHCLSELNRRLLLFMGESETRLTRTYQYIAAQALQGSYGFCNGSKRLFDMSERFRMSLVHNARAMGLFQEPAEFTLEAHASEQSRWEAWLAKEQHRRLGWAVYQYDASVSYLHNRRPSIVVGELSLGLPSEIALWEAESAQAWMALHPWSDNGPQAVPFRNAMRSMYANEPSEKPLTGGTQHQYIIATTFARFIWSLKELESSPTHDLAPEAWPMGDGKLNLLKQLDRFLSSPTAKREGKRNTTMRSSVEINQIVHMSHLTGAGDLLDWLHTLARSSGTHTAARARMVKWGSENSRRVRDVAFHSAQMLALVREYPFNHPAESYNAFWAGVALWCMAHLLPPVNTISGLRPAIQIDSLGEAGDLQFDLSTEWVEQGGEYAITLYGIPDLVTLEGRFEILEQTATLLEKMPVWGISNNFFKVVLLLIKEEERGTNVKR